MTSRPSPAAHRRTSRVGRLLAHGSAVVVGHGRALAALLLAAAVATSAVVLWPAPSVESRPARVESRLPRVESRLPRVESRPARVESRPARVESRPAPAVLPAAEVLRAWDRRRAEAYATGSTSLLRSLYVRNSSAGTADVAMLRAYQRNGLRVTGMRMQLLSVEVVDRTPSRWVLRVTDRLHHAVAVGKGTAVELPRDRASTRTITLRRSGPAGPWRVASVR